MNILDSKTDFKWNFSWKDETGSIIDPITINWCIIFYTNRLKIYEVSHRDGVKKNWIQDGKDIVAIFENHNMGVGVIKYKIKIDIPDDDFEDGICNQEFTEFTSDIELI